MENSMEKQKNKLSRKDWLIIALMAALLAAMAAALATNLTKERRISDQLKSYPTVYSQEEFEAALRGVPGTYLVDGAAFQASGPAKDPFDILKGEYSVLNYQEEIYEDGMFLFDADDFLLIPGGWKESDKFPTAAAQCIYVYGSALPDISQCVFFAREQIDLEEACRSEEKEKISGGYYYPQEKGGQDKNLRYTLKGAGMEGSLTFVARLGDNQAIPQPLNGAPAALVFGGGLESLTECLNQQQAANISAALLCGGVGELLLAGLLAASISRRKKKGAVK